MQSNLQAKLHIWAKSLHQDSLFRNSFYLMLNTGVIAILGFCFWLICARIFNPDQIGIATSLISAMSLISYMSLLGFNNTFIRILPTSTNRSDVINTGLILSISAAIIIGTIYAAIVPELLPKLDIILDNFWYAFGFVLMVTFSTANLLTDSIFVSFRGAQYNLMIDGGIMSIIKLVLPLAFVGLGAYGVFLSSGAAAGVALMMSVFFLTLKFDYKPEFKIHTQTLRNIFRYSSINYIANLLNIAPTLILPLIVLNYLGTANAGYYYLAFTVASLLYAVAYSVSSSLFAEGSYRETALNKLFKRSITILATIMIPAGIILALFGPLVLRAFGKSYSEGASHVIVILALAAPAVTAYTLGNVLLRITHQIYSLILVNAAYLVTISGLAVWWAHKGLAWIAVAWLIGNAIAATVAFLSISFHHKHTENLKTSFSE